MKILIALLLFATAALAAQSCPALPAHCTALAWSASASAASAGQVTSYNVYESATATGTFIKIGSSATTSYADTGTQTPAVAGQIALTPGQTINYYVTAVGPGGESTPSNIVAATTPFPRPVAPAGLSAVAE